MLTLRCKERSGLCPPEPLSAHSSENRGTRQTCAPRRGTSSRPARSAPSPAPHRHNHGWQWPLGSASPSASHRRTSRRHDFSAPHHRNLRERLGIPALTLYAFSVENWRRPKAEIDFLMRLLREYLRKELPEIHATIFACIVIGRPDEFAR